MSIRFPPYYAVSHSRTIDVGARSLLPPPRLRSLADVTLVTSAMTGNCANPAPEDAGCSRARTAIFRLGRIFVAVQEIADLDHRKPEGRVGKAA